VLKRSFARNSSDWTQSTSADNCLGINYSSSHYPPRRHLMLNKEVSRLCGAFQQPTSTALSEYYRTCAQCAQRRSSCDKNKQGSCSKTRNIVGASTSRNARNGVNQAIDAIITSKIASIFFLCTKSNGLAPCRLLVAYIPASYRALAWTI
jgi:hypothetical protein